LKRTERYLRASGFEDCSTGGSRERRMGEGGDDRVRDVDNNGVRQWKR